MFESREAEAGLEYRDVAVLPGNRRAHLFRLSDLVARCPHHHSSPCHPLFPVDQKATVIALVRVYWLRLPQWLPLCLVAVTILAVWRPDWPIFVVVNLLLALAVTRLAIGVLARLPFGGGTTLSGRIISWRRVAAMIPIALLWFTGAFGVWFYFHWIVPIASLSVLMLAIWITNRHVDRHFLLVADFDVLSPTTRRSSSLLQNPA
jgi:hypothetical protein